MSKQGRPDRFRTSEWGSGYFTVDDEGHLTVRPERAHGPSAPLSAVVARLADHDLTDPLLIRFPQILTDRQARIHRAFDDAIREFSYPRPYQGVFPVKVNHDRIVVETLVESGRSRNFGLEVGSKAELCLALTIALPPDALVICNGFKDKDYLELAVHAAQHGRRVVVIAENPQEVDDIIATTRKLEHRVSIGFRARLHTEGIGRWQESSGHKGKFGLSSMEIVEGIDALEDAGILEDLVALHFHIGSQVCDILNVKSAIKEASRLFCSMKERAIGLDILDIGGGLGVDYDGSRSATDWSVNYTLGEYARDAVYIVKETCTRAGVEPPVIVSESGRALTAHHAMVVLSSLRVVGRHEPRDYSKRKVTAHQIADLKATLDGIDDTNYREAYHDAKQLLAEVLSGFRLGYATLDDRAVAECLHRDILHRVRSLMKPSQRRTQDMVELERQLAPKFVCNFSVFMSAPDTWAVNQLFPICPLDRLDADSLVAATIGDITCDSDGKLERFIGRGEPEPFIWLHDDAGSNGKPYLIGMFLLGAYQDVLGDFHNLFGTVDEGVVRIQDDGSIEVIRTDEGSSVESSLDYFGFDAHRMVRNFDRLVDRFKSRDEVKAFKGAFLRVLHGNTYLERL